MMYPVVRMSSKVEKFSRDVTRAQQSPPDVAWRVRAGVTIPAGITVGRYPSEMLLGTNTMDHPKGEKYIEVKVKDKMLIASPGVGTHNQWLLHVTPARDRHEQNVEAIRDARGMIAFRIIKEIQKGDELFVWYSTELAMECNIPILTPANIRGGQEYTCTSCDVTFRHPNTLKAHVRFHCARNTMTSLLHPYNSLQIGNFLNAYQQELSKYISHMWTSGAISTSENIAKTSTPLDLSQRARSINAVIGQCNLPLSDKPKTDHVLRSDRLHDDADVLNKNQATERETQHARNRSEALDPSMTSLHNYRDHIYMCNYARYSGSRSRGIIPSPKPLELTQDLVSMTTYNAPPRKHKPRFGLGCHDVINGHETKSPGSDGNTSPRLPIGHINFPMPSDTAGEPIDLLPKSLYMSNAFKGHLCIYCGKLYSRKYGLKIHLRTHTGYKPLKCKVCLRAFGDPSNLNKHMRLHADGDTPYRCEYCGKVLVRRRDLERHVKSRHHNQNICMTPCDDDNFETLGDSIFVDVDDGSNLNTYDMPIDMSCRDIEIA